MIDVMKAIDFNQQGVKLTYQFSPLSWHFYAFKIHQGINYSFIKPSFLFFKMLVPFKHKSLFHMYLLIKMILLSKNGLISQLLLFTMIL